MSSFQVVRWKSIKIVNLVPRVSHLIARASLAPGDKMRDPRNEVEKWSHLFAGSYYSRNIALHISYVHVGAILH